MRIEQLQTDIFNWLSTLTNATVIRQNENGPKPDGEYIAFTTTAHMMNGQAHYSKANAQGEQSVKYDREFTLSIQSYRGSEPLDDVFEEVIKRVLTPSSFVVYNWAPIQDVTALLDERMEARFSLDLFCRAGEELIAQTDFIETVEVTPNLKQELNDTITIGGQ